MKVCFTYDNATKVVKAVYQDMRSLDWVTVPDGQTRVDIGDDGAIPKADQIFNVEEGTFSDGAPSGPSPLEAAKNAKKQELRVACSRAISEYFESDALGVTHSYPATLHDQNNMLRVSATGGELHCANADHEWLFMEHTPEQGMVVLHAFQAKCSAQQVNLLAKTSDVDAADTVEAVNAITWA